MARVLDDGLTDFPEVDKIIKTPDSIIGFIGDKIEYTLKGISDFSKFSIKDGLPFDELPKTEIELLSEELTSTKQELMAEKDKTSLMESQIKQLTVKLGDALLAGGA